MAPLAWGALLALSISLIFVAFNLTVSAYFISFPFPAEEPLSAIRGLMVQEAARALVTNLMIIIISTAAATGLFAFVFVRRARRTLAEVAEMQKRFISHTSHEMRTPLAIMKTGIEVALMQKDELSKEAIEVLENNLLEVNSISRMMNALIALSRFDDPLHAPPFTSTNISLVLRNAVERYRALADSRNVSLRLHAPELCFIHGSEAYLAIMFCNVIKNAVTHNRSGGTVDISVRPLRRGRVEIVVSDTGVGISSDKLPYIFEPFYRAPEAPLSAPTPAQVQSTQRDDEPLWERPLGIGLSFVRRIGKLHRAKITVESTPEVGTEFHIVLPAR